MFSKIYMANDHGGFAAKQILIKHLAEKNVTARDFGSVSGEKIVRYPYYAAKVAMAVADDAGAGGILICSTGIGMSIIANKFKGIRAALCTDGYMAKMTRRHNNSNILCLGGKITGEFELCEIADIWLATEYEGGRHDISLGLIAAAENELLTGNACALAATETEDMI